MDPNDTVILFILIAVGLSLLIAVGCLLLGFAAYVVTGAVNLLAMASEQGFIGIIVYFAAWVFLLPVMIILCAINGWVSLSDE